MRECGVFAVVCECGCGGVENGSIKCDLISGWRWFWLNLLTAEIGWECDVETDFLYPDLGIWIGT